MQVSPRPPHRTTAAVRWELAVVLVLPLLLISPLLRSGLPGLADAQIHLFRTVEWDYLWRNGVLLPTWAPNLAFGYGYPLFNFAPPLPYVFIDVWHLLGLSFETAVKLLSIAILYLSSLGAYLFARRTLGFGPALLVAAAQIYTPFVFRQHLLYGGNYPQLLGMALFPWGLWALHRVLSEQSRSAIIWMALISGAALLSHLFQGVLLIGLLAGYLIFFRIITSRVKYAAQNDAGLRTVDYWHIRRLFARQTLYALGGLLLGVGLAAYFLLPVFIERSWTWAQSDYYVQKSPFALRFLVLSDLWAWPARLDQSAANPWVPFSLGPTLLGLAGLGLLTLPWQQRRGGVVGNGLFCALLLGASVFLMFPESEPLWQRFSFLSLAQFPWRLFGLPILAVAYLSGAGVQALLDRLAWLRSNLLKQTGLLVVGLLLILTPVAPLFYPTASFVEFGNPTVADHLRFELTGLVIGGTNLGEYTPVWVTKQPQTSPLLPAILSGQTPDRLDRSNLPSQAEVVQDSSAPLSFRYRLHLPSAQTLRFHLFYFPGWQAAVDGTPTPVFPEAESGLLLLDVPSGEHWVEVAYRLPFYRWLALAVSLASLVILLLLGRRAAARPQVTRQSSEKTLPLARGLALFFLLLFAVKVGFVDRGTDWLRLRSPAGQVLAAQQATDIVYGEKVRLIGFDLNKTVYRPGERMHIRLYWQAERPLDTDFTTFVHLDSLPPVQTRVTSDNEAPGDAQSQMDIPTSGWNPNGYVRDEHRFFLPADLPPLVYQVRVGLYNPQTGERLAPSAENADVLTSVHIAGDPQTKPTVRADGLRVGDSIHLLGYGFAGEDAQEIVCSSAALAVCLPQVTLYWRSDAAIDEDLTVLLHLIGPDGALYGQGDSPPVDDLYPTSLWLPGQTIGDTHTFLTQPTLPPGEYRIVTGLYRPDSGERLPSAGPDGPLPDGVLPLRGLVLKIVE